MPDGIVDFNSAYAFYMLAVDTGFTGIGFYPDWNPKPGFHIDVRHDGKPGVPVTWGYVGTGTNKTRVSMNEALEVL